jgi:TonB-dependent receptor
MNFGRLISCGVVLALGQGLLAATAVADSGDSDESAESTGANNSTAPKLSALQEITLTAQRTTEAEAREAQKNAENIVNIMTYDEIRKLPVVNSGDAVRIIPGVQLETDTGEGRFVNIRGLDSDLNSTTFGGVRLPPTDVTTSPYGGSRAVSFDALPSEMIGAVTVTKTNRPEQEAEALGGTIEITPKSVPADQPYFGDLTVGSGVEPLRNTAVLDLAGTFGGHFGLSPKGAQPFSAIGVLSYYEDRRGVDDLEEGYADMQSAGIPDKAQSYWEQRYYRQHKKRHVYGGELGYAPDARNSWFLRYYDFGVNQDYNRQFLNFPFSGNPTVNPDGGFTETGVNALRAYRTTTENFDTRLAQIGGSNDLEKFRLDYFVAFTRGSYTKPFDQIPYWKNAGASTITYNNYNSNFPSLAVSGANPYDTSGYTLNSFSNTTQQSITKDWSGKFNVAIPTDWTSWATEEIKFGIGARVRKFDQSVTTYSATSVPAIPLSQAVFGSDVLYYDDHYNMGSLISTTPVNTAFYYGTGFTHDPVVDAGNNARGSYDVKEDVYAGYGQYQFGFGKLGIFTGLRVEQTRTTFDAFAVTDTNVISPISSYHKYTDYLPSLQTRYEFSPSLIARAIYSETIARPGYNQQSPALNINLPANLVSQGNPNIKPIHAHNIDLSLEDYLPNAGIMSVGLFYKHLNDYIVPAVTNQTFPTTGIFAGFNGVPVHVLTFTNASKAHVYGYELNFQKRFTQLPGWWSGFGVLANWTGVDSYVENDSRTNPMPGDHTTLPSTAKNTGNAALSYEIPHKFNIDVGANYISRSLFAIGGSPALDVWSESRLSLDAGSRYYITDDINLYLYCKNITNTPLKYTEGTSVRPIQREFYRETWLFGVNARF